MFSVFLHVIEKWGGWIRLMMPTMRRALLPMPHAYPSFNLQSSFAASLQNRNYCNNLYCSSFQQQCVLSPTRESLLVLNLKEEVSELDVLFLLLDSSTCSFVRTNVKNKTFSLKRTGSKAREADTGSSMRGTECFMRPSQTWPCLTQVCTCVESTFVLHWTHAWWLTSAWQMVSFY